LKVDTVDEQLADVLAQDRLIAGLAAFFGSVAVLLACLGLYGLVAHMTARRTSEIGIRMALGASRAAVRRMVLAESLLLVAAGVVVGLAIALATTHLVASQLFGITPTDPLTLTGATALLIGVASIAGFVPASRASRVDPMVALRCE
jgi:ABC-type antimicrobial peptide transport system permease subunit